MNVDMNADMNKIAVLLAYFFILLAVVAKIYKS